MKNKMNKKEFKTEFERRQIESLNIIRNEVLRSLFEGHNRYNNISKEYDKDKKYLNKMKEESFMMISPHERYNDNKIALCWGIGLGYIFSLIILLMMILSL